MSRPPFDLLRACFWLLAVILVLEMLATITGGTLCWVVNWSTVRTPGACGTVTEVIREVWQEMLTAVLALLLAAHSNRSPPPPPGGTAGPTDD